MAGGQKSLQEEFQAPAGGGSPGAAATAVAATAARPPPTGPDSERCCCRRAAAPAPAAAAAGCDGLCCRASASGGLAGAPCMRPLADMPRCNGAPPPECMTCISGTTAISGGSWRQERLAGVAEANDAVESGACQHGW
jgi:hypothetical protein